MPAPAIPPCAPFGLSNIPRFGRRLMAFGDSKIALSFTSASPPQNGNVGFIHWVNRLMGNPFRPILNGGVSGYDTQQLYATYLSTVLPNVANYDVFWMDCGVNDARHAITVGNLSSTPATASTAPTSSMSAFMYYVSDQVARGKTVIWILPPPCEFNNSAVSTGMTATVANARKYFQSLRREIKEYLRTIPASWPVIAIDPYDIMVDNSTGTESLYQPYSLYNPTYSAGDQIHPYGGGALVGARRIASVLQQWLPLYSPQTYGPMNAYDQTYNPTGNFIYNPAFATLTGGTITGGVASGNAPQSVTVSKYNGNWSGALIALSSETPAVGAKRIGNTLIITPSLGSGLTANEVLQLRNAIPFSSVPGLSTGMIVRAGCLVELVSPVALADLQIELTHNGTTSYSIMDGTFSTTGTIAFPTGATDTLYFETPDYVIPANGASPSFAWQFRAQWNCVSQAASGAIKMSQPWMAIVA